MSLFTALATAFGGYGQGRQQRTQNQQNQEQIDQQKQVLAERAKMDAANLQQIQQQNQQYATDRQFESGLKLPANWTRMSPPEQQAYLQVRHDNALKAGDLEAAKDALTQIDKLQDAINKSQGPRPTWLEQYEINHGINPAAPKPNYMEQYDIDHGIDPTQPRPTWSDQNLTPYQRAELANRAAGAGGKPATPEQIQSEKSKWQGSFAKAIKDSRHLQYPGLPPGPGNAMVGKAPEVSATDISGVRGKLQALRAHGYKGPVDPFAAIDADPDPATMSQQLANMTGNQTLKELLLSRGHTAQMQRSRTNGVSQDTSNPTKVGPQIPQRSIWKMAVDAGATPQEATTLAAIAYAESGGHPGSVNPTDNGGKQTSWGLFQISDGTHNEIPGWDDPEANTRMAIQKLRTQGWGAWGHTPPGHTNNTSHRAG